MYILHNFQANETALGHGCVRYRHLPLADDEHRVASLVHVDQLLVRVKMLYRKDLSTQGTRSTITANTSYLHSNHQNY